MGDHADIDHTGLTGIPAAGSVATDAIWDAAGDLAVGTGANTAAKLTKGSDGEVLTVVAGAVDWAAPSGGIADQGDFTYLDATEAAAPATPASGFVRIYAKADGRIYSKDDTGAEFGPFDAAGGGGGGPLLAVDDIALDAAGDEFDVDMSGWTTGGSPTVSSVITTETYDDTCLELTFPTQSDRFYKAIDSGDWTYYLTVYGVNNSSSPLNALSAMMGLAAIDNSGNGTGMSLYNDGNGYMWGVTSNAYASSGNVIVTGFTGLHPTAASNWPIVYRLAKVGTTITGGISFDGGANWLTNTRSDSTTFTRIAIIRLFSSGDTNPKIRVGRFNLVP